ncbi:hypothetical protein IFM89_013249 [Coptis chinensis]|uniref:Cyclic nucleotide-binding domain-containing protein n=1 Tax=Coptis chinensis TaxID=261450 RepID=A0A835IWA3_9MAGN|nr:hypothetical protein IFM89_013249 [Coptis chinensis]
MAPSENEEIPMLSSIRSQLSDEHMDNEPQRLSSRTRSASMSIPMYAMDSYGSRNHFVSHTGPLRSESRAPMKQQMSGPLNSNWKSGGNVVWPVTALKGRTSATVQALEFPSFNGADKKTLPDDNLSVKNEHLLRSGQLGKCNDPYCTTCPTYYNFNATQQKKDSTRFESKFQNILSGDAKGWMRRSFSFLGSYSPGIMNPHAKVVQRWNKFIVISCLVAIFIDPLFFFLLSLDKFRLAYVSPESRVVGAGELVDQPKKIALHYFRGYFFMDVFVALPLPQVHSVILKYEISPVSDPRNGYLEIMILCVIPLFLGSSAANFAKNLLPVTVLLHYLPRFWRFLPLLAGRSASGFIFETAWANFVINLFIFVLAGHVVGSCWYLFGIQRVNQCLRDACADSDLKIYCKKLTDCAYSMTPDDFNKILGWKDWKDNIIATDCFKKDGHFSYGIYAQAVKITTIPSIVTRYIYSLFWGFQQISTLAGNQVPSDFVWEVLFTMGIVGLGLFLFALLIGNMQNFLQGLGRRRLEMQLRHRDVEQWMSYRRLPEELRRQVRQSERFHWAATRGVNEEVLLENFPEDLQREIRRHLFNFIKKIRILALMDEPILDAICERLRQKLYIKESKILYYGGVVDKMIFIVRGTLVSVDADGNNAPLSEGDICGEELLTWCLDHSSTSKDGRKIRVPGQRFLSNRTVTCLTNVEAFSLRASDLEQVTALFPRFLRSPRIQGAISLSSSDWIYTCKACKYVLRIPSTQVWCKKMAPSENEGIPMLSSIRSQLSDEHMDNEPQRFSSRTRSASMSIPMYAMDSYESRNRFVSHTGPLRSESRAPLKQHMSGPLNSNRKSGGNVVWPVTALNGRTSSTVQALEYPSFNGADKKTWPDDNLSVKNEHLLRSGQLGKCNDPYCTTCPTYYNFNATQQKKDSTRFESKFQNILSGDAKGWMRRFFSFLGSYAPGIMNPHAKVVQRWNKFFVISCFVAIFIDPLFFFLLYVDKDNNCIKFNWKMAKAIAVVRSITDIIYVLHILLQFRLAYVAPETRVVGAGELVDQPKKIALHYLRGYFLMDVFVALPLPQIMILWVIPRFLGSSAANFAKNLLRVTVLLQYLPRFWRFLPLLAGRSASGFIFETAWANFVINLFIFVLAGHVVGSCWYLFGLQRVNQCLRDACADSDLKKYCKMLTDCGYSKTPDDFNKILVRKDWKDNKTAIDCFEKDGHFSYGIYQQAVKITTIPSIVTRYIYSLFWGFQQISTLAGNQVPSDFVWEVLFTMGIVGLGLFLFALLIGNMQNFLQGLGRRRLEMQLRHRDVEQWMSYRRLPEKLRRQVRQSERFHWAATRGVNEEVLLENFPEDLQREIRRHLFNFIKKIRILALMDEPILDAICERLRQKLYIKESKILYYGGVVDKMIFIVRGKLVSVDADGNNAPLSEGDICGEELLTWCLDHSSTSKDGKKIRVPGQRFLSNRTVTCLTNVEAFSLRASDLEQVTALFPRFLRSPRIQGAIRDFSLLGL